MIDDLELIVVWSGTMSRKGEGLVLIPPRDTKPGDTWEPPTRAYNKTGKHTKPVKAFIEPDPSTEYCGTELVGGWCKRKLGHNGNHACS